MATAVNYVTHHLLGTTVTTRDGEKLSGPVNPDWAGGMNKAGSNAPGIGINTGDVNPKLDDWSLLDQAGAARTPQDSQHIGGNGLGAGDASNAPLLGTKHDDQAGTAENLQYVVADTAAADGAIGDTVSGTINRTGKTLAIGERFWGSIAV